MSDDLELLREYKERASDDAFRSLVERHAGMVHSAALRVVGNNHLAEEVTQAVFILLARKASTLSANIVLAGWLYRTAQFVAQEALRAEQRRKQRHERFLEMNESSDTASLWEQIAPILEDAVSRLSESERDAVVLRFFEGKSFMEVAHSLGTTEAAAKMRVGRALEKLRSLFGRQGIVLPASTLAAVFSAHAGAATPVGLSATVTSTALAQEAGSNAMLSSLVKGASQAMAWNQLKTATAAFIGAALFIGGGVALVQVLQSPPGIEVNASTPVVTTFAPMAGKWVGTFSLRFPGQTQAVSYPADLMIWTNRNGRSCDIEMRVEDAPAGPPTTYNYSHELGKTGQTIFTKSDPASGRGDGHGIVTESFHDPANGEWRVGLRFPLTENRGVMEGRWVRQGDELLITSHDAFYSPQGTNHVYAELKLRRRTADGNAK